jgi:N-acetylglucosaminyldiphosphoundecaprenol N-acetyl-beta-D-mannosaminyltransferase
MSQATLSLSSMVPTLRRRATPAPAVPRPVGDDFASLPVIEIGGAPVHLVDERVARRVIADATRRPLRKPLAVSSINLDHIHHFAGGADSFRSDGSVRWLNLIDGAPIAHQAQRMTGVAYPRLAGSDIVTSVLTDLAAADLSVGVVGGMPEVAEPLRQRLADGWPGLRFAGHWSPSREELSDPEACLRLCDEIRATGVNVLLVCLGKPRQERWISAYGAQTGADALLAFGAVVDFLAGRVSRAPEWVSNAGVEWAYRLMLEPRRLARRYLIQGPPAYLAVRRSQAHPIRALTPA